MCIKKSKGPRIDPFQTSCFNVLGVKEKILSFPRRLYFNFLLLYLKQDLNQHVLLNCHTNVM
jgi:hypothetical protein